MLTPHFTVVVEPSQSLLRITLGGFFALSDVEAFAFARIVEVRRLTCALNQHVTLVDVSACKLQSQEVVAAFQKVIDDPRYASRRLAFVTGRSLARMQVRRILTRNGTAVFDNANEAEEWLLDDRAQRIERTGYAVTSRGFPRPGQAR